MSIWVGLEWKWVVGLLVLFYFVFLVVDLALRCCIAGSPTLMFTLFLFFPDWYNDIASNYSLVFK